MGNRVDGEMIMQAWEMTPEEIRAKLDGDDWEWSFSRISGSNCLYSFFLHYIEENRGLDNGSAQFGKAMHKTLEKYFKGELDVFDTPQDFKEQFEAMVTCDFPYNRYKDLKESAYESGIEYLNNLSFDFNKYEILGVEKECKFKVDKYKFQGYIDLLLRDKDTGDIIIVDHKTTQFKYLKNGDISKTNQEQFDHFKKQELLYSIPVIEQYGKVDYLAWNMIRDKKIIKIPFDKKEFKEAQEWAINQIHTIENESLWLPNTENSYYCNVLCGQRGICLYHN